MLMVTTWYGTFLLEGDARSVVSFSGAGKEPSSIAEDLSVISSGGILPRERELALTNELTLVAEERLRALSPSALLFNVSNLDIPGPLEKGYGFDLLTGANLILAGRRNDMIDDQRVLSLVGALTDIDTSSNLLEERITEWLSKTWEAPASHLSDGGVMASLSGSGTFGEFLTALKEVNADLYRPLSVACPDPEISLEGIGALASSLLELSSARERIQGLIDDEMGSIAPNLKAVVGPIIGARLIHSAAGIKRLAMLPSSTVQVLGAEKAFFRFLKEGGRPPKHGILFQHPAIHSARKDLRGKIARTM
ncbi:MAG: hypothetical protein QCI82_01350, partial [Candidatus Thermoplasmatota archaeon]|nr:hypothetical protein [Candidatus Thermoplasmatota archaeon]